MRSEQEDLGLLEGWLYKKIHGLVVYSPQDQTDRKWVHHVMASPCLSTEEV